jgi:hypothetical protein
LPLPQHEAGKGPAHPRPNHKKCPRNVQGVALTPTRKGRPMKTERKPHLVKLKPAFEDAYKGKLQIGRQYQALFSLENATYMSIVGTNVTRAQKRHFDILPT